MLQYLSSDDELANFSWSTLYGLLKYIGFQFFKKQQKKTVTDNDDIVLWWRKHLRQMKGIRSDCQKIVCGGSLGERQTFAECSLSVIIPSTRLLVVKSEGKRGETWRDERKKDSATRVLDAEVNRC
jgi:hypothetical protein